MGIAEKGCYGKYYTKEGYTREHVRTGARESTDSLFFVNFVSFRNQLFIVSVYKIL